MIKFKKINLKLNLNKILNISPSIDLNINLNINYFVVIAIFLVFLLMMALNSYTPLIVDDMARMFSKNMIKIDGISGIISNERYKYANINPYQVGNFITGILLLLKDSLADFINSVGFCIFIYMISSYGFARNKEAIVQQAINGVLVILVFLFMWVSMPKFGNTFLMVSSIGRYIWVSLICLMVLINARKIALSDQEEDQMVGIRKMLLMIIASFLSGWSQENLAIGILSILLYYILRSYKEKRKNLLVLILSLVSMLTGFIVMMSSPSRRSLGEMGSSLGVDLYAGAAKMSATNNGFVNYLLIFMIVAILLLVVSRLVYMDKNWEAEVYLLAGIISFLSISLLPIGEKNPVFVPILLTIISCFIAFSVIRQNHLKLTLASLGLVLIVYIFLFIPSLSGALSANKDYLSRYNAREIIIIDNRTNGHFENIEIPPIKAKNSYMAAYGSPDGSKDPKYWVNQYISKYYGVGSVLVR